MYTNKLEYCQHTTNPIQLKKLCKRCRLEAAAPMMYEALKNLLDKSICDVCYEDECGGASSCIKGKDNEPCDCHIIVDEAEAQAYKALSLAEGR